MLQAAARIAHGQVPYRDFWWFYPPGQPYLLGGLWALFGPSLLTWRIVRVLADATVAVLAYFLALPRGAAAARARQPGSPAPARWRSRAGRTRSRSRSPACSARCSLFERRPRARRRADRRVRGLAARVRALRGGGDPARRTRSVPARSRRRLRLGARFALPALAVGRPSTRPVVIAAGFSRSWHLIVSYPATDLLATTRALPFPLHYNGPLNTSSACRASSPTAPRTCCTSTCRWRWWWGCWPRCWRWPCAPRASRWWQLATAVFACGMAHYLSIRPDLFHTAPLEVMLSILAAWALAGLRPFKRIRPARWRSRRSWRSRSSGSSPTGSTAACAECRTTAWRSTCPWPTGRATALPACRRSSAPCASWTPRVPRGQPIYVTTLRSDLVTSGDPLFYVLADRPNPTRYDIPAPGIVTSAPVQREIVRDLERTRPRAGRALRGADHRRARAGPGGTLERGAHPRPLPGRELPPGGQVRLLRDPRPERLMRLAYVLERYPELSQTFVEDELRELVRAGRWGGGAGARAGQPARAERRRRSSPPTRRAVRSGWPRSRELAARRPGDVAGFLARSPALALRRPPRARHRAGWPAGSGRARRSEHIHAHFATEAADVAALLGRLSGRPHSFTGHSTDLFADPAGLRRRLGAGGVRRARLRLRPPRGGAARARGAAGSRWCRWASTSSGSRAAPPTTPTGRWWPSAGWWSTRDWATSWRWPAELGRAGGDRGGGAAAGRSSTTGAAELRGALAPSGGRRR